MLWDNKLADSKPLFDFLVSNPDLNHMRFYWEQTINFEVVNPECHANWSYPMEAVQNRPHKKSIKSLIRDIYLMARRWLYSQNLRNKNLNIYDLLICPSCGSSSLRVVEDKNNIIVFPIFNWMALCRRILKSGELVCNNCASRIRLNMGFLDYFQKYLGIQ